MKTYAVKGGYGDFLQSLPFMQACPQYRYLVASHNNHVVEFFKALGVKVEELSLGRLEGVEICPRTLFFKSNPFPRRKPIFDNGRPVVGIHLGGSSYSLSIEKRFGFPPKALPWAVLNQFIFMLGLGLNFLLFGSPDELARLGMRAVVTDLKTVVDKDITVCLSYVDQCSSFVGSDSVFKTMSSMLRIPTVVWVGDYMDRHRDEKFIDPYVNAGVMSVYRYHDLNRHNEVADGVNFSLDNLGVDGVDALSARRYVV